MTRPRQSVDRRAFLKGRLGTDRVITPPGAEIASILVQARPERLDEVETAITALNGCEIYRPSDRSIPQARSCRRLRPPMPASTPRSEKGMQKFPCAGGAAAHACRQRTTCLASLFRISDLD